MTYDSLGELLKKITIFLLLDQILELEKSFTISRELYGLQDTLGQKREALIRLNPPYLCSIEDSTELFFYNL